MITEKLTRSVQKAATKSTQSKNMAETSVKSEPVSQGTAEHPIQQMPIHFIKSSQFRVVHASGVWYGGDAQQNIHMTFFNERSPIPKKVILNLNQQGFVLGEDESQREIKKGFVREVEVDVIFSISSAVEFYKTLGDNLKALKAI